jgi:hypothetical protein
MLWRSKKKYVFQILFYPIIPTILLFCLVLILFLANQSYDSVAQLVEQQTLNLWVESSILSGVTILKLTLPDRITVSTPDSDSGCRGSNPCRATFN